jgi:hypothetical protein
VRTTHRRLALACALALAAAAPAAAEDTGRAPAPARAGASAEKAGGEEAMDWPAWIEQLETSAGKVRGLRRTVAKFQAEVSAMISRRYPRGEEKERLLTAQARAIEDLAEAEAQHAELLEQARQADVPQGLLMDYEDLEEMPAADAADSGSDF